MPSAQQAQQGRNFNLERFWLLLFLLVMAPRGWKFAPLSTSVRLASSGSSCLHLKQFAVRGSHFKVFHDVPGVLNRNNAHALQPKMYTRVVISRYLVFIVSPPHEP